MMITLDDTLQGSEAWHNHRNSCWNASDIPAIMGVSPYKSRSEFMREIATGITPEHDDQTIARFSEGHRSESLARPLIAKIIGQPVFPVVGYTDEYELSRPLSASYDALVMDESEGGEHKSLNDEIRRVFANKELLPELYTIQMEVQCMVSHARRMLFMASKWEGDVLLEELHCWYEPNQELRERILLSIRQFERDLAAYVPPEVIEKPVAEVIMQLPAVVINATGGLSVCNLRDITPEFDFFLSGANTVLVTDSDFVNADSTAKFSRTTAKTLKLKAKEVVDQIATVSEAVRTLELYAEKFDSLGLKLEKLVKSEKEARKLAILSEVRTAYYAHVAALEVETAPIKLNIAVTDFAVHMKGLQKLDSVQNAVNTALANAKIAADATAKDIRGKLAWFTANVSEDRATMNFRDLHEIIRKPMDDFQLVVCTRQEQVAKAEADKLEAQRVQMQAEADAKAKAAQDAILAAERTKMEAEVRAKAVEEAKERAKTEAIIRAVETTGTAFIDGDKVLSGKDIFAEPNPQAASQIGIIGKMPDLTPSRDLIIKTVSRAFNVDEGTAYQWLRNAFAEVAA